MNNKRMSKDLDIKKIGKIKEMFNKLIDLPQSNRIQFSIFSKDEKEFKEAIKECGKLKLEEQLKKEKDEWWVKFTKEEYFPDTGRIFFLQVTIFAPLHPYEVFNKIDDVLKEG